MNKMVEQIARILYDKKAVDIVALDVSEMTVITDCMLIASGRSTIQVRTLADEVEERMAAQFMPRIDVYHSAPFFIEAMPVGVNKGESLAILLEKLGMTAENLMACGDSGNDLAMIKLAGIGVAMGNAEDYVKEAADFVSADNDHDGVAVALEQFVL